MCFDWKFLIIKSNITNNIASQIINVISLMFALIISSLFCGFYLSQNDLIRNQHLHFAEYLSTNIEKSESVASENDYFRLRKVSRPSMNEVESLLRHGIHASIHLNYAPLFLQNPFLLYGRQISQVQPVFLKSFDFDQNQQELLTNFKPSNTVSEVYINQSLEREIQQSFNILDNSNLYLEHSMELTIGDYTISRQFSFKIIGTFNELDYLSTPKIYFSQHAFDLFFSEYRLDSSITFMDVLENLSSSESLSGQSYRLYFETIHDFNLAQKIVNLLKDEDQHLSLSSEHLTRLASLREMFTFTNLVVFISSLLVIISLFFINFTITHTEIQKANAKHALLYFYGAKTIDFIKILSIQNIILLGISCLSFFLVEPITTWINEYITKVIGISNFLSVPLSSFLGVPYLLPILILLFIYFSANLISIATLFFTNQKSLIKRLAYHG